VSRWDDGRDGTWKPRPAFKPQIGEGQAIIWEPSGDMHIRYKFPGGAERTQERLHAELDAARAKGEPSITLG
jgi:hypothetical protein